MRSVAENMQADLRNWNFVTGSKESIYAIAPNYFVNAMEDVEAPGYTVEIPETIVGTDTVPAGTYGNGNMEIHCEDHGDHDH